MQTRWQRALAAKDVQHLRRKRLVTQPAGAGLIQAGDAHYLNFAGNDYLGLSQAHPVLQSWTEGLARYGAGSGASALVTGYSPAHERLEKTLAESLNREAVLLLGSGFAANQAICQACLEAGDRVVADKLIHASFIDGAQASRADFTRFKHNDLDHLVSKANPSELGVDAQILVATEGVFSMDGDQPPLADIAELCRSDKRITLMVDDAHSFGVMGDNGLGSAEQFSLSQDKLPVLMATFGKALGTAGAFIAGSRDLIDFLVNHARHAIYTTSMPPAQAHATLTAFELMQSSDLRDRLKDNIALFKRRCADLSITVCPSNSAIQPVIIGDPERTMKVAQRLKNLGVWVGAMRSPTVPAGQDRLRVTLSAVHSSEDICALTDALGVALEQNA